MSLSDTVHLTAERVGYTVDGEVYSVKKFYRESGIPCKHVDPNWYEYRVWLLSAGGDVIASWDSLTETYNGYGLTRLRAEEALARIKRDIEVEGAPVEYWFSV